MVFLLIDLFWVFGLVLLLVIVLVIFIKYNSSLEVRLVVEKEKIFEIEKERLKIAERKYMQGKIKKEIYDELRLEIEEKLFLTELDIFRLKKIHVLEIEDKLEEIYKRILNPTKHRRVQLAHLLTETELVRKEMGFLESKLMKHELSENLFKKLIRKKEQELISLEIEIVNLVKVANKEK